MFHVVDPAEIEFPFSELTEFEDMESPQRLLVDPKELRAEYLAEINAFIEKLQKGCSDNRIEYPIRGLINPIKKPIFLGHRLPSGFYLNKSRSIW